MRQRTATFVHPQRDPRRYRFPIPNAVWEYSLRPPEFLVLSFLCCYQSKVLDTDEIARCVHLSTGTVKKYLASLKAKGLVTDDLLPTIQCPDGKNYFTLPNEIFLLTLPPSAFLVYAYLLLVEDRHTHQCHSASEQISLSLFPGTPQLGLPENSISLHCSSFPHRNRFAGLRRGPRGGHRDEVTPWPSSSSSQWSEPHTWTAAV